MNNYNKQYRIFRDKQLPENIRRIHWDIITICNYNCEYCYSRANESQWNKISNANQINNIISQLDNIIHPIEITLLGGEPTLHPKYYDIFDRIYNLNNIYGLNIISNGNYKDINVFIDKHSPYKDKFKCFITFHPSQGKDIDIFKSNFLKLKEHFYIEMNILLIESYELKIEDMLKFCYDNNIYFRSNQLFESHNYKSSSLDFKIWMNKINKLYPAFRDMVFQDKNKYNSELYLNDIECYDYDLNNFYNWTCFQETYYIPVASTNIVKFCVEEICSVEDINKVDIRIKCPLKMCLCPGKVTPKKIK